MKEYLEFWEWLAAKKEERGLTDYEIAKRSGLTQQGVSNIIKSHAHPYSSTIKAICDGIGEWYNPFGDSPIESVSDVCNDKSPADTLKDDLIAADIPETKREAYLLLLEAIREYESLDKRPKDKDGR